MCSSTSAAACEITRGICPCDSDETSKVTSAALVSVRVTRARAYWCTLSTGPLIAASVPVQFTLGLQDVRVYTFGSPRVGNDVFATFFDNEIKARSRTTAHVAAAL